MPFPIAVPDHSLAARGSSRPRARGRGLAAQSGVGVGFDRNAAGVRPAPGEAVCFSFRLDAREPAHGLVALPLADTRCGEASLYLAARKGRVLPVAAAAFLAEELESAVHGTVCENVCFRRVARRLRALCRQGPCPRAHALEWPILARRSAEHRHVACMGETSLVSARRSAAQCAKIGASQRRWDGSIRSGRRAAGEGFLPSSLNAHRRPGAMLLRTMLLRVGLLLE